jgi:hypothetical protein
MVEVGGGGWQFWFLVSNFTTLFSKLIIFLNFVGKVLLLVPVPLSLQPT